MALSQPEESDDAKYISEKTLYTMRQLMITHNLDTLMFANISDKLAKVFDVDTKKQRIDSVHIQSNMRKLGRISIIARTISKFLSNLKRQHCQGCPLSGQCKLRPGKNKFLLHYSHKQYRLAARTVYEQSEAFTESYRWRAGVEATMSEFNRRTSVKKLRVRGMTAVRFAAIMKATGLNLLRAGSVWRARRKARKASLGDNILLYTAFKTVKEQILTIIGNFRSNCLESYQFAESGPLKAA